MKIYRDIEQGSPEWFKIKLGKVSGTRLKELRSKDNLGLIDRLIAEIISERIKEVRPNEAMQRGTDMEPIARQAYEDYTGHKVEQVGFIQSSQYEWFGLSPDGIINENGKYLKATEIKCPDTEKHVTWIRQGRVPAEHRDQVLSYFIAIPDLIEHDFVSYDNRFTVKPILIINTRREDVKEELKEVYEEMDKFWVKFQKYYNQVTF